MRDVNKAPDAFRTISEVAEDLDLPQHVLRFWETRFSQIKPMKRGGGRRYYRPEDINLLKGIRHLLYGEGYTIKGVQRILKEQGVRAVADGWTGDGDEIAADDDDRMAVPLPLYAPAPQADGLNARGKSSEVQSLSAPIETRAVASAANGPSADRFHERAVAPVSPSSPVAPVAPVAPVTKTVGSATGSARPSVSSNPSEIAPVTPTPPPTVDKSDLEALAESYAPPSVMAAGRVDLPSTMPAKSRPVAEVAHGSAGGSAGGMIAPPFALSHNVPQHLVDAITSSPSLVETVSLNAMGAGWPQPEDVLPHDILPDEPHDAAKAGRGRGLLDRLKSGAGLASGEQRLAMNDSDFQRLQATLVDLLECKRLLDQIR